MNDFYGKRVDLLIDARIAKIHYNSGGASQLLEARGNVASKQSQGSRFLTFDSIEYCIGETTRRYNSALIQKEYIIGMFLRE